MKTVSHAKQVLTEKSGGAALRKIMDDDSSDPKAHSRNVAIYLHELKDHCRKDISEFKDPAARALFETAAEVLNGLGKAFADFDSGQEEGFKRQ